MSYGRPFAMLAAAMMTATPAVAARHGDPARAQSPWRLAVARDAFSGEVRCTLQSAAGAIVVAHRGVGFRFGRHDNTLDAWYRIDGGAPTRWQDRYPRLIADGVPMDGPGLRNPTGGIVWLPIDEVRSAQAVTIRPAPRDRPRTFATTGLAATLDSAARQGCGFDVAHAG